jgi:uncharacterized repeat protein (TIGR01451 family)
LHGHTRSDNVCNIGDTKGQFLKKLSIILLFAVFAANLPAAQLPVALGSSGNFTILGGSTVTNTGPTIINGNLGVSPGSAVTGFPPGTVVGGAIHVADPTATTAQGDLTTAYNDAAGRTVPVIKAGDLGGLTLTPDLYKSTSSLGITGVLTLDGQGNPNAVFIFQIASSLTTASGRQVVLIGGAQAANIFWQVGSSATLGTTSVFNGTILALQSISLATGAALNGRALARNGAVTLDTNTAVNPGPPTSGGPPAALTISCPSPNATTGVAYNSLIGASGGTPPYTFSLTGSLPPVLGLNSSSGAITGTPAGTSATFTAKVQDSLAATASSSCTISVAAGPADLSIVKSVPATAAPATNVTYTLTVSNAGPNSASAVTVTDVLPTGTTFVSTASSQGSCAGTSTVTCNLGVMANGSSATITLVVVSPNAAGPVVNTATVSSTTADPNSANNSSSATFTVTIASVPALSSLGLGALMLLLAFLGTRFSRRAEG